jgi:enoyl-CoA hydratase/carnithine racemase
MLFEEGALAGRRKISDRVLRRLFTWDGGEQQQVALSCPCSACAGEPINAERVAVLGLVNRVCEPGGALAAALELAESVRAGGPLALIAAKQILDEQWDWPAQDMWERQAVIADPVMSSEDAREGCGVPLFDRAWF